MIEATIHIKMRLDKYDVYTVKETLGYREKVKYGSSKRSIKERGKPGRDMRNKSINK